MTRSSSSSSSIPKPSFDIGCVINGKWKVVNELGCGGCGIVYEVEKIKGLNCGIRAAMKAESVDVNHKYSETLFAEALVLRRMQWSPHFCRLYLAGRCSSDCNIIVMSLVGRTLSWLRRQNPSQRFTLSTALRLSLQCIEAIEHLHSIGILHRDVKGSNFAVGQNQFSRIVHMIDFGFARFYLTRNAKSGEISHRPPRKRAPYLGTDRYCSVHVHNREEQGRRDDLWSFLYMMVEFIVGQLPWRSSSYRKLLPLKNRSGEYLLRDCPIEFYKIYDHIRHLGYEDRPHYELIRTVLSDIREKRHFSDGDPFDWEEGGRYDEHYLRAMKQKKNKEHHCNQKDYDTVELDMSKNEHDPDMNFSSTDCSSSPFSDVENKSYDASATTHSPQCLSSAIFLPLQQPFDDTSSPSDDLDWDVTLMRDNSRHFNYSNRNDQLKANSLSFINLNRSF